MEQIFKEFLQAISPALQTLIVALVTLLLGQATFYVQKKYEELKASVSSDKRYLLDFLVIRAVQTVEQLYKESPNQEKKDTAIAIVEAALKDFGLSVDIDVIADAVEAGVFQHKETHSEAKG